MDINMIKDSIEKAIDKGSRISITYSKDGETTTIIQLTGVSYSAKYGKDYITGLSGEKELTLKIDRIVNVEFEWIEINNGDICSINDGIYLIAYNAPWFLAYELWICKKGEKILDGPQDNGNDVVDYDYSPQQSLAYHYIPLYDNDKSNRWVSVNKGIDVPLKKGIYIVAYKLDSANVKNRERKWIRTMWRCSNDIYYSYFIIKDNHSYTFPDALRNPHIEIIAYYICSEYNLLNTKR